MGIVLLAGFPSSALAQSGPDSAASLTVAVVVAPGEGEHWQAIEGQLLAALSGEDIELVERQQLSAVLDELRLAMAGVVDVGEGADLSKLVPADVFVLVEPALSFRAVPAGAPSDSDAAPASGSIDLDQLQESVLCHLRVVETRSGIVLGQLTGERDDLVRDIAPAVTVVRQSLAKARADVPDRRYVAVLGFQSEEAGAALAPQARSLKHALVRGVADQADIVLLERDQLQPLARERTLTGRQLDLRSSSVVLLGGVRRLGTELEVSVRLIPLGGGRARTVSLAATADEISGVGQVLAARISAAMKKIAPGEANADVSAETAVMRQRASYLLDHGELDEAIAVGEAAVALDASQANLEALMAALLSRWPVRVRDPFDSPLLATTRGEWYRSDELYYLARRMLEVEARLCRLAVKGDKAIDYAGLANSHVTQHEIDACCRFLPFSEAGALELVSPKEPILRRRAQALVALSGEHGEAKRAYYRHAGLGPAALVWRHRFAVQTAQQPKQLIALFSEAFSAAEELVRDGTDDGETLTAMKRHCMWLATLAERKFSVEAIRPVWQWLKSHSDTRLKAAGYFGMLQAGGTDAEQAEREMTAAADGKPTNRQEWLAVFRMCQETHQLPSLYVIRRFIPLEEAQGHLQARRRLRLIGAREAVRLALGQWGRNGQAANGQTECPPWLKQCVLELARQGELRPLLKHVIEGMQEASDASMLLANAAVFEEMLSRSPAEGAADHATTLLAILASRESTDDATDVETGLTEKLRAFAQGDSSQSRRFLSQAASPAEVVQRLGPWAEYGLTEIPIGDVPWHYGLGRWDNIVLQDDRLLLVWRDWKKVLVDAIPVSGGRLQRLATFDVERHTNCGESWRSCWPVLHDGKVYVARSWYAERCGAWPRVRDGKPPVGPDWPGIVVFEKGELVKSYSERDGLPGQSVSSMVSLDGVMYLSMEYRRPVLTEAAGSGRGWRFDIGPGALARFDPQAETFEVLASSSQVSSRHALDGGKPYGIVDVLADAKRHCLWLRVVEAESNGDSSEPSEGRSGIWKYTPADGAFEKVATFSRSLNWSDEDHLAGDGFRLIDANTAEIVAVRPEAIGTHQWHFPNGEAFGRAGARTTPSWKAERSPLLALDGLFFHEFALCDPTEGMAYPYPGVLYPFTTRLSHRLPGDGGILVASEEEYRLFRVARGYEAVARARKPLPDGDAELALPDLSADTQPPEAIVVRKNGRFAVLNTRTGKVSDRWFFAFRARRPREAFLGGPAPMKAFPVTDLDGSADWSASPEGKESYLIRGRDLVVGYDYIDADGKNVTTLDLDMAQVFSEGLGAVRFRGIPGEVRREDLDPGRTRGDQHGFVDRHGRVVVNPSFTSARGFSNGRAAVSRGGQSITEDSVRSFDLGGKYGFCDRQGNVVVPLGYEAVQDYSEGLAAALTTKDGWGYLDLHGRTVIPHIYATARPFRDGVAWVSQEDRLRWGIRPHVCQLKDPMITARVHDTDVCRYLRTPAFRGRWRLIDPAGREATNEISGWVADFQEGLAWFHPDGEAGWGCIDPSGRVVIDTQYVAPLNFRNGLARAATWERGALFGFLDRRGRWAIPPQFSSACSFSEGLAAVCVGGRAYYETDDYEYIFDPADGLWGYVNRGGEWVFPPQFEWASDFRGGVAEVRKGERVLYIDTNGKVLFDAGPQWTTRGTTVVLLDNGGTAERLGVQLHDILLRIDDEDVCDNSWIESYDSSKPHTFYFARGHEIRTVDVPPGSLGLGVNSGHETRADPETIPDRISETTPPIERARAEIIPYRPAPMELERMETPKRSVGDKRTE
jgi:hypothetical protein